MLKNKCLFILLRGKREGLKCGRKCGEDKCYSHKNYVAPILKHSYGSKVKVNGKVKWKCEHCEFLSVERINLRYHRCYYRKNRCLKEKYYQRLMEMSTGGKSKKCLAGVVDIVTNNFIIEIKRWTSFKNAIGQILSYSIYHPNKNKCLYMFGKQPRFKELWEYKKICRAYDIILLYDTKIDFDRFN